MRENFQLTMLLMPFIRHKGTREMSLNRKFMRKIVHYDYTIKLNRCAFILGMPWPLMWASHSILSCFCSFFSALPVLIFMLVLYIISQFSFFFLFNFNLLFSWSSHMPAKRQFSKPILCATVIPFFPFTPFCVAIVLRLELCFSK